VAPYDPRSLVTLLMERLGRGEGGYAEAAGGKGHIVCSIIVEQRKRMTCQVGFDVYPPETRMCWHAYTLFGLINGCESCPVNIQTHVVHTWG
jgi:hypothetical protein